MQEEEEEEEVLRSGLPWHECWLGQDVTPAAAELLDPGAFLITSVQVEAAESGSSSQALCTFSFAPKAWYILGYLGYQLHLASESMFWILWRT